MEHSKQKHTPGAVVGFARMLVVILLLGSVVSAAPLRLQILHSSDNESSFQNPNTLEPKILHYATIVDGLQKLADVESMESIHLTAGDHVIPGPFFQAAAEVPGLGAVGLADIAIYNTMGLTANGMGNHEFDGGIDAFAQMVDFANYPFLAVNLDFSQVQLQEGTPDLRIGEEATLAAFNRGKVVKSVIAYAGGRQIGILGRAPAGFFDVIKDPATTLPGLDFLGGRDPETNQPLVSAVDQVLEQVDFLEALGVNIIILLDHAQDFTADPLSAQFLRGIDVIVAAGSTGFMAKASASGPFNMLRKGDTPGADYPTVRQDSEGSTVLVVNSDQLYQYVGNLMVTFDDDGHLLEVDDRSGPVATTVEAIAELENILSDELETPAEVQAIYDELQATPLIQDLFAVIGTTVSELNGQRADVRSKETNLGRLASDSTLWYAREKLAVEADLALKNGGGIRDTILGPSVTKLTVSAALAFDNKIAILEMTGAQVIAALENAVSVVPALDGRFPQVAGMMLEYDASQPGLSGLEAVDVPSRVKTLVITRADGTEETLVDNFTAQGDLDRTFLLATNDFLSTGGDGYAALAAATKLVTSEIGEQQILAEYIAEALGGQVDVSDPPADARVVRLDQ